MRPADDANHPPVLLALALPEGGIQTFEARPGNAAPGRYTVAVEPGSYLVRVRRIGFTAES